MSLHELHHDGNNWVVDCPEDVTDPARSCLWSVDANDCLRGRWEEGHHHPSCDDQTSCREKGTRTLLRFAGWGRFYEEVVRDDHWSCWPSEPDDCVGFDAVWGHGHPSPVCGLAEAISIGWDGPASWDEYLEPPPLDFSGPVEFEWIEGCAAVWPARQGAPA